jgi:hypothetical protein
VSDTRTEPAATFTITDEQIRTLMERTIRETGGAADDLWNDCRIALGGGYVQVIGGPEVPPPADEVAAARARCAAAAKPLENAPGACGMFSARHPDDERRPIQDDDCMSPAIGTTEDNVRVCAACASAMAGEGFAVTHDAVGFAVTFDAAPPAPPALAAGTVREFTAADADCPTDIIGQREPGWYYWTGERWDGQADSRAQAEYYARIGAVSRV